jgi:hypothetical protein
MKNLLYILLFVPFTFLGQTFLSIEQDVPLEFQEGWNMFGYSCYEPMDVIAAFSPVVDKVVIVKDNSGAVYMTEFGFNGIGNLEINRGYQIKTTEAITDFQFCSIIIQLIEGCMDESAFNYDASANSDDGSCYPIVYGCMDPTSFNYNDYDGDFYGNPITGINGIDVNTDNSICIPVVEGCTDPYSITFSQMANVDDGSCLYLGCLDSEACNYNEQATTDDGSCEYPELGYDCDGNIVPQYQVGDLAEGGIIFQINEDGTGLVSALEDLGQFEWGCYGEYVDGADGISIGTGYQNTLDIVAGCSETPIAASEALAYESEGYTDWYLPSFDELYEMYNTIGNVGSEGNIGGFSSSFYWSSSEYSSDRAWSVGFSYGSTGSSNKASARLVRIIRAF